MSEIKHTMPDTVYIDRYKINEPDLHVLDHKSYSAQFTTSYTRTDIVHELVEALECALVIITHSVKPDKSMFDYLQQALNKAKGKRKERAMITKTKLKPCPFCGRTNIEITPWQMVNGVFQKVLISCATEWEIGEFVCPAVPTVLGDTYEHAAKLWNTRKGTNK